MADWTAAGGGGGGWLEPITALDILDCWWLWGWGGLRGRVLWESWAWFMIAWTLSYSK